MVITILNNDPIISNIENLFIYAINSNDNNDLCCYTDKSDLDSSYYHDDIPDEYFQVCVDYLDYAHYSISELNSEFEKLKPIKIENLIDQINTERDELCYSPITYSVNGTDYLFKADAISQQDITDSALDAMMTGESFSKDWITYNGIVTLDYNSMIGLKYSIGNRRQNLVYQAATMKQSLLSLSYEELMLYVIQFS